MWVKLPEREGPVKWHQPLRNSEYRRLDSTSQTLGAKVHRQKGNSPDETLRSQSNH